MFYVSKVYSKFRKHHWPAKVVGYKCERSINSPSAWHREEYGHNWIAYAAYNWARLREEGGARMPLAATHAIKRKFQRKWTIERFLKRAS